jgi:hypothetical protein
MAALVEAASEYTGLDADEAKEGVQRLQTKAALRAAVAVKLNNPAAEEGEAIPTRRRHIAIPHDRFRVSRKQQGLGSCASAAYTTAQDGSLPFRVVCISS